MHQQFFERLAKLEHQYQRTVKMKNAPAEHSNGVYQRYINPVLTAAHIPIFWRYDLFPATNPYLIERFGINAVFNAGAIKLNEKYMLVARVEGLDRKSFFAVAESPNGIDNFTFRDYPIVMPETDVPDTNIYDMRVVKHEDGWIYGLFCTERRDPAASQSDQSSAVAQCGIARTKDLTEWYRLPDLVTPSPQQRNVVLHSEFVNGKYAFYTRPQDSFINAGEGAGIGFGLADDITNAVIHREEIIDRRVYHTVYELKNGEGAPPIKTNYGWLHQAHGVRNTAAGLRYTIYLYMTDLHDLTKVIYKPAGYFIAPEGEERIGDVSNVTFSNGWILDDDQETLFIYYASSDTRMHVATTTLSQVLDYVMNNPPDGYRSAASVQTLTSIIANNKMFLDALV